MPHGVNRDGVPFDREQNPPITRSQPHAWRTFECLDIANTGFRECFEFEIDLHANNGSDLTPLSDRSRRKLDLFHRINFAQCDAIGNYISHIAIKAIPAVAQVLGAMQAPAMASE
jgi:hypothetical protein